MDFLAEDPTGGAGIGCPGLKRETGLAPTIVAPQGLSTIAMQVTAVNNDLRVLTV